MSISLYIGLTGLSEATSRLQVASENVANASSIGFKARSLTDKTSNDGDGVIFQIEIPREPMPFRVHIKKNAEIPSNVGLDTEMTALIRAKAAFKANLRAIKVEAELLEDAINLKK